MVTITLLALIAYFVFVAFERFGVTTKFNDLFVGVAALVIATSLILTGNLGL